MAEDRSGAGLTQALRRPSVQENTGRRIYSHEKNSPDPSDPDGGSVLLYPGRAVLPFVCQPKVSEETKERFEQKNFYGETAGAERAAVLSDNVDALAERIRLISHAEERIILSTFEFRNDESGKDMMAAFLAAADRGVQIQILMDGFPAFKNLQLTQDPYFQALSSHENIQIFIYNPVNLLQPWKLMGRLHDKYLIADESAYILGGRIPMIFSSETTGIIKIMTGRAGIQRRTGTGAVAF